MDDLHLLLSHLLFKRAELQQECAHARSTVLRLQRVAACRCSALGCLALQRLAHARYVGYEAQLQLEHIGDTRHVGVAHHHLGLVHAAAFLVIVENEVACLAYASRKLGLRHVVGHARLRYHRYTLRAGLYDYIEQRHQSVDVALLVNDRTHVRDYIAVDILIYLERVGV